MSSCQEFQIWLNNQKDVNENTFGKLMTHARSCRTCHKLYQTDTALEDILKNGMQRVDTPKGLIARARERCQPASRSNLRAWRGMTWKSAVPVFSMAALTAIMLLNLFVGPSSTLDDLAAQSIANHLNASLEVAYLANDAAKVSQRLTQRLGHEVRLPDLSRLGLKLLGGRKCNLGKIDAAFIFCDANGSRASLFVIHTNDMGDRLDKKRRYIIKDGEITVTVWQESEMVYALVV